MASHTFTTDLQIQGTEDFGTKLNSHPVAPLHPDICVNPSEVDSARTNLLGSRASARSTWLPGKLAGSNLVKQDAEEFVDDGAEGTYTKFQYGKVWDHDNDITTPEVVNNGLSPNGAKDILEIS